MRNPQSSAARSLPEDEEVFKEPEETHQGPDREGGSGCTSHLVRLRSADREGGSGEEGHLVRPRSEERDGELEEVPSLRPSLAAASSADPAQAQGAETDEDIARRVAEVLDQIEAEEDEMVETLRGGEYPLNLEENDRNVGFSVLVTRFGQVYHLTNECPYLTAPRVGMARNLEWCLGCANLQVLRGRPPPGFSVWTTGFNGVFHTNSKCPHLGSATMFQCCIRCKETL